jgi:hypothetical protein
MILSTKSQTELVYSVFLCTPYCIKMWILSLIDSFSLFSVESRCSLERFVQRKGCIFLKVSFLENISLQKKVVFICIGFHSSHVFLTRNIANQSLGYISLPQFLLLDLICNYVERNCNNLVFKAEGFKEKMTFFRTLYNFYND